MKSVNITKFSLALVLLTSTALGQGMSSTITSIATEEHDLTPAQHADIIRQARLKEMTQPMLTTEATPTCEYVSGISNAPPHNVVYLTFDDGPDATGTPYVLDILKKYGLHATFFEIGEQAKAHISLTQQVFADGHIIGDHTWTHPDFHTIATATQTNEFNEAEQLLLPYMGSNRFFRYPYGNSTCATNDTAHNQKYKIVGWHVDSCDWAFDANGSVDATDAKICAVRAENVHNFVGHVIEQLGERHGGILLMHEIQPNTIVQLETIIVKLKAAGYTFGELTDPGIVASLR